MTCRKVNSAFLGPMTLRGTIAVLAVAALFLPASPPPAQAAELDWPRRMEGEEPIWNRSATIVDIDGNGDWELALMTTEGRLYVYQHDGANYPGFPTDPHFGNRGRSWVLASHPAVAAALDVDGDRLNDLAYTTDIGYLHVVGEEGVEPDAFPRDIGRDRRSGMPALVDFNGDNDAEIIFHTYPGQPDSQAADALMNIVTGSGEPFAEWPVRYPRGSTSSPAVGDLDFDGLYEVVVGNAAYMDEPAQVYAWRQDGLLCDGFPVGDFETIGGAPTLADLDDDSNLEILVWAAEFHGNFSGIYGWNSDGEQLNHFPLRTRNGHPTASPAVGDIDGDGSPEIVFGTFDPGDEALIYAWSSRGVPLDSFPIATGSPAVIGSVVIADVSGDGVNDVVAVLAPSDDSPGSIGAWDFWGRPIEGFPITSEDLDTGPFAGPPTVWDLYGDGSLDIIAVTTDRWVVVLPTQGVMNDWDYWPTEKGNFTRTGVRPLDSPDGVPGRGKGVPSPVGFALQAYPNPFNATLAIQVDIPSPAWGAVSLFTLRGERRALLYSGRLDPGTMRLRLDAARLELPAGQYYCRLQTSAGNIVLPVTYMP